MNREFIVKEISDKLNLPTSTSRTVLNAVLDYITTRLIEDGMVSIRNFGKFELYRRNSHYRYNVNKQKHVKLPAKYCIKFKPCKAWKESVNGEGNPYQSRH